MSSCPEMSQKESRHHRVMRYECYSMISSLIKKCKYNIKWGRWSADASHLPSAWLNRRPERRASCSPPIMECDREKYSIVCWFCQECADALHYFRMRRTRSVALENICCTSTYGNFSNTLRLKKTARSKR